MRKPVLSAAQIAPTTPVLVTNQDGEAREILLTEERALALFVDKREVISLMTLGQMPEALVVGWLLSQRLIASADELEEVIVDWEAAAAAVRTRAGLRAEVAGRRVITSGCGQGTMFEHLMKEVESIALPRGERLRAAALFDLLAQIRARDTIYKRAGAVHACALAQARGDTAEVLCFVEDIGRHNAADAIAGWMALNEVDGAGKVFYTTGRLTSEMVIKCAQMRIPFLASRSGTTAMGHALASAVGLTMLGRVGHGRFLVLAGEI